MGRRAYGDRALRVVPSNPDSPPVPEKPCASCGTPFQPTVKRRMLCALCFRGGDGRKDSGGYLQPSDFPSEGEAAGRARFNPQWGAAAQPKRTDSAR